MGVSDATEEVEDGSGMTGDAKVWPGDVVELVDLPHLIRVTLHTHTETENKRHL